MPAFPFVGPAYQARSSNFDAQVCLNLYPEMSETGTSKSVACLVGTPGYEFWTGLRSATAVRGLYKFNSNIAIAVSGGGVFKITLNPYSLTTIGEIIERDTPVAMSDNGTTVMLVTGYAEGYFIDPVAGTVIAISSPDFVGGTGIGFVGGRLVWNKLGTGQFQYTDPYDATIKPLNFYTAESSPDNLLNLVVNHSEVWLYGEDSVETWVLTGDNTDPFARIQGGQMETGIDARLSLAKLDNTMFWLGGDARGRGIVMRANGYSVAQRVSTHAIEFAISQYDEISDAQAFSYQEEGHTFYVLTFPTAGKTWVYDVATSLWHERAYRQPDGSYTRWRANCQIPFDGDTIVGDYLNGSLYRLKLDVYRDVGGVLIPRVRACPHLSNDLKQQLFHSLQIDMETGVGLSVAPGVAGNDPQAMLRWSDDGGHTWSNELWVSVGKLGEFSKRAKWRRLGRSRDRVFKVTITDPVKVVIIGASVEVTPCQT